jgi:RecA-family ATPase
MPAYQSSEASDQPKRLPRRTRDYLERGAVEGERNARLFDAACQFRDAGHTLEAAEASLMGRALADGLEESEALHAIRSAYARPAREPATATASAKRAPAPEPRPAGPPAPPPPPRPPLSPLPLPEPPEDGFLRLLEACFQDDEFVSVAPASETDDGEVAPRSGVTLTAAEWKSRVTAKGGIDRCFSTRLGLFIRLNPMQQHGSRDEQVTSYRHVLVEFDRDREGHPIPKEDQHAVIAASGLPVSVLIDSGNKSLHAWVRVDAKDEAEYRKRVAVIWDCFETSGLPLDRQNRNPARLSRCPDGWRTVDGEPRRQRLLATKLGAPNWAAWDSGRATDEAGDAVLVSHLAAYDTAHDPNAVLGQRWLCRGGSLVIVGQSGIGKSSFCMQLMLLWALDRPAFGIKPIKPLRSLLIQAENDIGDLAEMYQGVRNGLDLTEDDERLLEDRLIIYRDTTHCGEEFVAVAASLIERHRPDLVWVDPLLNFVGDDISEQKVISDFCCRQLNAVSLRTGVIWCLMHHTGKPSKDPKAASHWTASDLAYSGIGSSALTNWAREMAVLVRLKTAPGEPPTFQLSMTKRRLRAGLTTSMGQATDTVFLRHSSDGGICWELAPEPPDQEQERTSYKVGRKSDFDPEKFRVVLDGLGGTLTRANEAEAAAKLDVSVRTAWRWYNRFKSNAL